MQLRVPVPFTPRLETLLRDSYGGSLPVRRTLPVQELRSPLLRFGPDAGRPHAAALERLATAQ
jgi:hypothetical protein